jgi:hypothetical protein
MHARGWTVLLGLVACGTDAGPAAGPRPGDTGADAAECSPGGPAPRQLRLLSRREFSASINDIFGWRAAPAGDCTETPDCDLSAASCVGGTCTEDPCGTVTFLYRPSGAAPATVHVAGSFNGWAPTLADGGLPLAWAAADGVWWAKAALPAGRHTYKLVLDERTWVADPANPATEDDGYGGVNSVVTVDCSDPGAAGGPVDWGADLPVEVRPPHYPFDQSAEAGLVTAVYAERALTATGNAAARFAAEWAAAPPCDAAQAACQRDTLTRLGRRAWRRPLQPDELDAAVARVAEGDDAADGLALAVQSLLFSPHFLYRSELGEPQPDGTHRLSDHELAAALSYTLWGTTPDDALLDAADAGRLSTPEGVRAEAARLLADPRARDALGVFVAQWLGVERVATADKSPALFPEVDTAFRADLLAETRDFSTAVFFDRTGSLDELLTADWTVASPRLAAWYGATPQSGGTASLTGTGRAGVLGHGSVLFATAHSDQTSPVRRGLFVRERLLCQSFGVPPANAGGVPDVDPSATTRERFAQHAADPSCAACHTYIDPLGFGFEHFDAAGAWRATEAGVPIDASAELRAVEQLSDDDRAAWNGLPQLAGLLADSRAVGACFTREAARWVYGRDASDPCALARAHAAFDAAGRPVLPLFLDLLSSPDFRARQ